MKKVQLLLATLVCSGLFSSAAFACIAPPTPMNFWVFDAPGSPGDGSAKISITNYDLLPPLATLEYSVNDTSNWQTAGNSITMLGEANQIFFQLRLPGNNLITTGTLSFLGQTSGTNFYNGATILWDSYPDITVGIICDNDKISPVPVPAACYLLTSGILGLAALRRKKIPTATA